MIRDGRIGKIQISSTLIDGDGLNGDVALSVMFSELIILRVEYLKEKDVFEYVAYSKRFDIYVESECCDIPSYLCICKNDDGIISVSYKKI